MMKSPPPPRSPQRRSTLQSPKTTTTTTGTASSASTWKLIAVVATLYIVTTFQQQRQFFASSASSVLWLQEQGDNPCIPKWNLSLKDDDDDNEYGNALVSVADPSRNANHMTSPWPLCRHNPYINSLQHSLEDISQRTQNYLKNATQEWAAIQPFMGSYSQHGHQRFDLLQTLAPCQPDKISCVGGACTEDESKIACGIDALLLQDENDNIATDPCIIYSIGGNNMWKFENDLLQRTSCEIHTFDCTGPVERFVKPNTTRSHFHHVCLGTQFEASPQPRCDPNTPKHRGKCGETWSLQEMQTTLQHSRIDLLKLDIEGWEWPLLESWTSSSTMILPKQIMVEVHYRTNFRQLWNHSVTKRKWDDFKSVQQLFQLQQHLFNIGYAITARDDNRFCKHCTELTLTLVHCNETR